MILILYLMADSYETPVIKTSVPKGKCWKCLKTKGEHQGLESRPKWTHIRHVLRRTDNGNPGMQKEDKTDIEQNIRFMFFIVIYQCDRKVYFSLLTLSAAKIHRSLYALRLLLQVTAFTIVTLWAANQQQQGVAYKLYWWRHQGTVWFSSHYSYFKPCNFILVLSPLPFFSMVMYLNSHMPESALVTCNTCKYTAT